ncbi:TPA_asm: nucleocapsid protein [Asclepias syriaca virus 3]|uniref:Nucleoprotein n=1 Tax=Asclepias syriaca virus 3 TaxID=2977955 RepID=A0A9N6YJ12_9RHAB|nr:TPA_asm: nucleocapsid protein [Asclepias syriaca virus 3]
MSGPSTRSLPEPPSKDTTKKATPEPEKKQTDTRKEPEKGKDKASEETTASQINKAVQEKRTKKQEPKAQEGKISMANYINSELSKKYGRLRKVGTGIQSDDAWSDKALRSLEHLMVVEYQNSTIEDQVNLVEAGVRAIFHEVTHSNVGALMASAFLLKSPENHVDYIFKDPDMIGTSVALTSLQRHIVTKEDEIPEKLEIKDKERFVMEGAYLCGSILRLVTKEASNVKNAWNSIRSNFGNFYQQDMTLDITPSLRCLESIRVILQNRAIMKNTVSLFLLNIGTLDGQELGLCRMLFEIHLAYTGMHSYNLLMYCTAMLKAPLYIMFQLLTHPAHADALKTIETIIANYDFPDTEEEKKIASEAHTWRYARIFDPKAFANIQTRNCGQLTAILALLAQKVGAGNAGDVTKIRQIAGIIEGNQEWLEDKALKILGYCRSASWVTDADISGLYKD